jgi:hypothetical protein
MMLKVGATNDMSWWVEGAIGINQQLGQLYLYEKRDRDNQQRRVSRVVAKQHQCHVFV